MNHQAADAGWRVVAQLADFQDQRKLALEVDGVKLLLLRQGGGVMALHNACPHLGQPLDGGRVMAGQLTCPFHGACFDLKTGAAVSGPAVHPLHRFPVELSGEQVLVDLRHKPPNRLAGFGRRDAC